MSRCRGRPAMDRRAHLDPTLAQIAAILGRAYLRLAETTRAGAVSFADESANCLDAGAHRRHCHNVERAPRRRACRRV